MKEIGKLIELLNEYQNKYIPDYPIRASEETINSGREILISKRFGFIEWLVENDKIDLGEKLFNLTKNDNRKSIICDLDNNDFSWEDTFLMLLSISDTPIEDLCEYLKDDNEELRIEREFQKGNTIFPM